MSYIVITGCSSGLGRAIALALHRHYLTGIDQTSAGATVVDQHLVCNLENKAEIRGVIRHLKDHCIDVLINCAGVSSIDWFQDIAPEEYDRVQAINTRAIFQLTQGLLPQLQASRGTVLNILSDAAVRPMTASLAYNISKAAAAMMTLQMARELGRQHGITVFGIAPAKIADTAMSKVVDERVALVRGWTAEYTEQYHRASVTMQEDIPVEVLAQFVAYLLANKRNHQWLNGCIIPYGG